MKTNKPLAYKSLKTGNEYLYEDYANHGKGGWHSAFVPGLGMISRNDLPKDEYPYTLVYRPEEPTQIYNHPPTQFDRVWSEGIFDSRGNMIIKPGFVTKEISK